jgi:transposase
MTRSWIGSDQGRQTALPVPVDARDQLPAGHAAFTFVAMVEQLDLSAFFAVYRADGRGRPPFHPKVMLTLILYCRSKGIMSGRDVAAACYDDLGARMITGNQYPKRSTIDRFMKSQRVALKGLLSQTLRLGHAEGLVDVSVVAGDGTYMLANAAMGATVDEKGLLAQIADLEQKLAVAEATWQELAGVDDTGPPAMLFADADADTHANPPGWPVSGAKATKARRRVCALTGMLRSRRAALGHLRTHPNTDLVDWTDKLQRDQERVRRGIERLEQARATAQAALDHRHAAEASGKRIPGTRPVPAEKHIRVRQAQQALSTATTRAESTAANRPTTSRVNTTDPTSRVMPGKHDGFDQRHNVQALACKNQFVIAITTHDSPNDKQALINLLQRGRANLDAAGITDPIEKALFDNGYASEANFTADLPVKHLLVAVEKEARQTERLRDGASTAANAWHAMAVRLADPDNRKLYKRRGAIIEPLFAQLFARFGRNLNLRGEDVDTELHLWAITHNLLKISRHRRKPPRPG